MAIFRYRSIKAYAFIRGILALVLLGTSQSFGQDANELADKLSSNYDSCKQIIIKLEEGKPYDLDDQFWLEQQLVRNMLGQESPDAAIDYAASLTKKYKGTHKEPSTYINRGNLFYVTGEYEKAVDMYNSAIDIAEDMERLADIAKANNNKAGCLTSLGNYQEALNAINGSIDSYLALKDSVNAANTYLVRGNNYFAQDIFDEAMSSYQAGLEMLVNQGDSQLKGSLLNNMALIFNETKQWTKAISYLRQNISICQALNIPPVDSYTNLGESYRHINLDSALYYYELSLGFARESPDPEALYRALNNIGLVKEEMGYEDEALEIYNEALTAIDNNFDYPKVAQLLINIANIETLNQNYDRAKKMANLALEKSLKRRELQHIQNSYASLYSLAKAQKNYEDALKYDNLRDEYRDSVLNESSLDAIAEYEAKYQLALKEQLIAKERNDKLQAINKQKSAEAKRQESELTAANRQKWIFGLVGGILAIAFLALFVIQRNRRKAQAEKDAAIISERDKGLQSVISAQEEERKRISKELHDGIGQQLSGIKLAWQNLSTSMGQKAPEEFKQLMTISSVLDETTAEVRNLSHQMMPRALQESGLIAAIEGMLQKSLQFSNIQYEFDHYNVDKRFSENLELSMYRICQELINNVIKHSDASSVMVQLFRNQDKLILIVEDNGKGISKGDESGHGLLNIRSRLNTVHGTVNYEPSPNSGTIATIVIPIN